MSRAHPSIVVIKRRPQAEDWLTWSIIANKDQPNKRWEYQTTDSRMPGGGWGWGAEPERRVVETLILHAREKDNKAVTRWLATAQRGDIWLPFRHFDCPPAGK